MNIVITYVVDEKETVSLVNKPTFAIVDASVDTVGHQGGALELEAPEIVKACDR